MGMLHRSPLCVPHCSAIIKKTPAALPVFKRNALHLRSSWSSDPVVEIDAVALTDTQRHASVLIACCYQ
jgi:hypothetical protein